MLSIDDILKPEDLPVVKVAVPEWGGEVFIRAMRADERDAMETEWIAIRDAADNPDKSGFRGLVVAYSMCDENGKVLITEPLKAYRQLGAKNAAAISRLFNVACKLSGLTKEDEDELAKNS